MNNSCQACAQASAHITLFVATACAGLSELFQVGGCDEKVGGCKSRRGKTLRGSGGMPTGTFLNLESLKWHFLHFQKRFINQVF